MDGAVKRFGQFVTPGCFLCYEAEGEHPAGVYWDMLIWKTDGC
jgi:hypothetical protein